MVARSPETSIHKSCTAGPMRLSSRSTKCGPPLELPEAGVHSTLPAWQSPCRRIASHPRARECRSHALEGEVRGARPGGDQFFGNEAMLQEIGARLGAERRDVDGGPERVTAWRTDRVEAPEEAAEPFERRGVLEFRRASAAARKDRQPEAVEFVQRLPAGIER